MSQNLASQSPLSYLGVASPNPPKVIKRARSPTDSDFENFLVADIWIDTVGSDAYMLVAKSGSVGTWARLGGVPDDLITLTTPDSTVVVATDGNINFLNGDGMAITGSGSAITFSSLDIRTITTPDTNVVSAVAGNVNFLNGDSIAITSSSNNITFDVGRTWNVVTTTPQTIVVTQAYIANDTNPIVFTLPVSASVGDIFRITSINTGGWSVAQNAGQQIQMLSQVTTTGVGGSLAASVIGSSIEVVCTVDNTSFLVLSSMGNITVA